MRYYIRLGNHINSDYINETKNNEMKTAQKIKSEAKSGKDAWKMCQKYHTLDIDNGSGEIEVRFDDGSMLIFSDVDFSIVADK